MIKVIIMSFINSISIFGVIMIFIVKSGRFMIDSFTVGNLLPTKKQRRTMKDSCSGIMMVQSEKVVGDDDDWLLSQEQFELLATNTLVPVFFFG